MRSARLWFTRRANESWNPAHVEELGEELDQGLRNHRCGNECATAGGGEGQRQHHERVTSTRATKGITISNATYIGTGSTLSLSIGLLLSLRQVPADVPEGFATIATFKRYNVAKRTRLLLSALFAIPIFLEAVIGNFGVRGQPEIVKFGLLAFTAGILLTVVIEEMIGEAHEGEELRAGALMLVGGFALFGLIATYLGCAIHLPIDREAPPR